MILYTLANYSVTKFGYNTNICLSLTDIKRLNNVFETLESLKMFDISQ